VRIIDPHTHIWTQDPAFPWPDPENPPTTEECNAEILLDLMAEHGVEKTVLVQPIHNLWNNRYVIHAAKKYPDVFMAVGRVNPEDPDNADHLSKWTEEHGMHGVRLSPSVAAAGDWFTGPIMPPLFKRAEQLGVPMLILTGPGRLPDLARLLEGCPDLDVSIDHMADVHPDDAEGRSLLMDLARFPRVYVKISHTWSISKQSYPWSDTHNLVEEVYQTFGAQRIMWGTDWPVCLAKTDYVHPQSLVREEMSFLSPEDLEWVLGKTVLKLWPFGEDTAS
jgi:L-fuconolactonase